MPSRKTSAAALAALGLSSLSPVQQGAAVIVAGSAALFASPALASINLPGVGIVVKKKPGNCCPIIAHADAKGETRITGLEPGLYAVRVLEGAQEVPMRVGPDGRLAFKTWEDQVFPKNIDPRVRIAPTTRRWAEQIALADDTGTQAAGRPPRGPAGTIVNTAKPGNPPWCPPGWLCAWDRTVIAGLSAPRLAEATGISREAAQIIATEQARNGPFADLIDFARRICPQTAIDFGDLSVRFGSDTMLVKRGSDPKNPGFRCARGTGEMELFGKKHNYVGHVTLLR